MVSEDRFYLGHALSDVADKQSNLQKTLKKIDGANLVELQPEYFSWDFEKAKKELEKLDFISMHAPCKNLDLSSDEGEKRYRTILNTIKSMDLAHYLGAKTLVLHPVNNMFLDPRERLRRKEIFLKTFRENIVPHYEENNHGYEMCVENIEYPKYPSTLEETLTLHEQASTIHPVKMVIDIPHVWNSRRILQENPDNYKDWTHGYPIDGEDLAEYVTDFLRRNHDNVGIYHIAGFGENPVRTHDPLEKGKINEEYFALMKELKKKPIVMEIYDQPYSKMIESRNNITQIAEEQEHPKRL